MKTFKDILTKINDAILEYKLEFGTHPDYLVLGKKEREFLRQDTIMKRFAEEPENITDGGNVEQLWGMKICKSSKESMLMVLGEVE